jgi:putative transposase
MAERPESIRSLLIVNAAHLRQVLAEHEDHFNAHRPHRALTRPARLVRYPTRSTRTSRSPDEIGSVG